MVIPNYSTAKERKTKVQNLQMGEVTLLSVLSVPVVQILEN